MSLLFLGLGLRYHADRSSVFRKTARFQGLSQAMGTQRGVVKTLQFKLSGRKKLAFALFFLVVTFGAIELVLAMLGVRPRISQEDPYVGFHSSIPLFERVTLPTGEEVYRVAKPKRLLFNEQSFPVKKSARAYRIFCMGGSTTHGRPYRDKTSFVGWLREYLSAADPDTQWQVINCGGVSYASYRVATLMEELSQYEPDLFIVYTGQNEFLERRTYNGIIEEPPVVTELQLILARSRLVSVIRSAVAGLSQRAAARKRYELSGEVKPLLDSVAGMDLYHRDDALQRQIIDHFRFNLGRMISIARESGADIVFVQPAVNLKSFSPFKSEHRASITPNELDRWNSLVMEAGQAIESQDSDTALERLTSAIAIDDLYADTHFQLGRVLFARGDFEQAEQEFVRALNEDVCPLRMPTALNAVIADVCLKQQVALIDFRAFLRARCQDSYGHRILGEEFFIDHVHPTTQAHRMLARLLFDHLVDRGTVTPSAAWNDSAERRVAEKIEASISPREHAIARGVLAKVLRWAGKIEESDRLVDSARSVLATDAEGCVLLGNRLERQGKVAEAIAQYKHALSLNPTLASAFLNLAAALTVQQQYQEAVSVYEEFLAREPNSVIAVTGLARVLGQLRRYQEALEVLQGVRNRSAPDPNVQIGLGIAEWGLGHLEKAVKEFQLALELEPRDAEALGNIGLVYRASGRNEKALEYLQRAHAADPNDTTILSALAGVANDLGRGDDAIEYYQRLLRIAPDQGEAHFYLGILLHQKNMPRRAIRHFEAAVEYSPDSRPAHFNLGFLYFTMRDYKQAKRVFGNASAIWPDDVRLLAKLALILAAAPEDELRDGEEAMSVARRAVKLAPVDPDSLDALAAAYAENGDFAGAATVVGQALDAARTQKDKALIQYIEHHQRLFERGQAYRLPAPDHR